MMRAQKGNLAFVFDSFCDHLEIQAAAHTDDGGGDGRVVCVQRNGLDERTVDLQLVDGKLSQIAQTGIAGPEVVDRERYSHSLELLQQRECKLTGGEQQALGEFQFEKMRRQSRFLQRGPHHIAKSLLSELN